MPLPWDLRGAVEAVSRSWLLATSEAPTYVHSFAGAFGFLRTGSWDENKAGKTQWSGRRSMSGGPHRMESEAEKGYRWGWCGRTGESVDREPRAPRRC